MLWPEADQTCYFFTPLLWRFWTFNMYCHTSIQHPT